MEIQNALNVGEETYEIEILDWLSEKEGLPKTLRIKIIRESDKFIGGKVMAKSWYTTACTA